MLCTGQFRARSSLLNPFGPSILQLGLEILGDDLVLDLDIKGVRHLNKHVGIPRVHWNHVKFCVEFVPCQSGLLLCCNQHAILISVLASDYVPMDIGFVPRDGLAVDGPQHSFMDIWHRISSGPSSFVLSPGTSTLFSGTQYSSGFLQIVPSASRSN